jgi:hypothetical protein
MKREAIEKALELLNERLSRKPIRGELGIVGGAAMCLAFNARAATKDVDGIFEPSSEIRLAAADVAEELALPADWINDAAKAFIVPGLKKKILKELSHLSIWTPEADYMLAMKCMSARFDSSDGDDVRFLIRHLQLPDAESVFRIIEKYYPRSQIPSKTQFFVEEIFKA